MNLHFNLENYLQDLQELLNIPDEQALLDQAEDRWTANDYRYLVLLTLVEPASAPQKFKKPASPPKPEPSNGGPTEPNVIVR